MSSSKLPDDFDASQVTLAHLRAPQNQKWLRFMRSHLRKGNLLKKYPFNPAKAKLDKDGNPIKFDAINFQQPALTNVFSVSDTDKFTQEVFNAIKSGLPAENPPNGGTSKAAKQAMERTNNPGHTGVKPSIQNGLLTLATEAVDRCADQVAENFRSKFQSKLMKVVPDIVGTISPNDFDQKLEKAMFDATAPTITSSTKLAERFIYVLLTEENHPTKILTTPTSPIPWADEVETHKPSDMMARLEQGSSGEDDPE